MSGVQCASRHKEASAGGGSFAPQGVLIARQILAFCVARIICLTILPICYHGGSTKITGGPYQTNLWSYINDGPNCATEYNTKI